LEKKEILKEILFFPRIKSQDDDFSFFDPLFMSQNFLEIPDEVLATQARSEKEAFATLIDRYESRLLRYILRISSLSQAEAEDTLQEVFVKLWQNINEYDESQKFSSWIYRITHNETISAFRKKVSRGDDQKVSIDDEMVQEVSSHISVEKEVDENITTVQVHSILQTLPEKYKEVLVLRFLEGYSYGEMADILSVPEGTVATLLSRAKDAFKKTSKRRNLFDFLSFSS